MKPGTLVTKVVVVVIALAVAAYLTRYVVDSMTDPFETTLTYEYTLEEGTEVTGWLVRSETVVQAPGTASRELVEILPEEGEKVAAGGAIARVYQSAAALELQEEITRLSRELSQVQYIMSRNLQAGDTAELEEGIEGAITAIRAMAARGQLSGLSSQTEELKNLVYRREYTYNEDAGLEERESELSAQLKSLRQQAGQGTTAVRASAPGVFSAQVDGYETVLTPAALAELSPSGLEGLVNARVTVDEGSTLGKLITSSKWYLALTLDEDQVEQIGKTVTVRFSQDYTSDMSMQVERISDPEEGSALVVLSSTRYLSETTLLRKQSADLIYQDTTGLRVPQRALRIRSETQKDEQTGQETQVQVTGVYAVTGSQLEWRPVTVLAEGDGFYLVAPANPDSSRALRSGDEIVVRGEDIYDGKVIRQ